MLRITGSICRVEGLDTIEGSGPYVILSNHRSHMDAPVLVASLPFPFGFLVKKELMRIPIFAGAMKSIGCVEVNRDRDGSDHRVLDAVSEQIAQGRNILVFPEGTRSPNDDFLPFKNGGAVLAIKAGVPVLPVAVSGTNRVVPARILRVTPGPLLLRIGKAIPTSGLTMDDRYELMDDARRAIESMYVPDYRGDS
ncbi:1-acyl-sn-glycerol-3-phosphate acyltransferase [Myxococcota bacterium]|nr:1-acyl-sn-glycerol-3-phosphate acyltransferase [Myxococcota bacterium]